MSFALHPFVLGSVLAGLFTGLIAGSFFGDQAALLWGGALAANAAVAAAICAWRPGLGAPAWKLGLVATLAGPLLLAGLGWSLSRWECLVGERRGWECLFGALGLVAAVSCLPAPFAGLLARYGFRPRSA